MRFVRWGKARLLPAEEPTSGVRQLAHRLTIPLATLTLCLSAFSVLAYGFLTGGTFAPNDFSAPAALLPSGLDGSYDRAREPAGGASNDNEDDDVSPPTPRDTSDDKRAAELAADARRARTPSGDEPDDAAPSGSAGIRPRSTPTPRAGAVVPVARASATPRASATMAVSRTATPAVATPTPPLPTPTAVPWTPTVVSPTDTPEPLPTLEPTLPPDEDTPEPEPDPTKKPHPNKGEDDLDYLDDAAGSGTDILQDVLSW